MSQSGKNVAVAIKVQSAKGAGASGADATGIRLTTSSGLTLEAADIQSQESRRDGQTSLGRLGSLMGNVEYPSELSVGGFHELALEATLRGTWTAAINLDEASNHGGVLGAITITGTNTITNAAGSWITAGMRVGQMIKLAGSSEAANNDKWIRVTGVTASVITVPTGDLVNAGSDAEWDIQIAKHLVCANPPTERYFTIEESFQDLSDEHLTGTDFKFGSVAFGVTPDNHVLATYGLVGRNVARNNSTATFTTPAYTTTTPLVLLDGKLRIGSTDETELTGFELAFDASPSGLPIINARISPDVYMSNARGSGSVSSTTASLARFAAYIAETDLSLWMLAQENTSNPKRFFSVYAGKAQYRGRSAPFGSDGALIETLPLSFGLDNRGAGYAESMLLISTSGV